eukprot:TRINITY_DN29050_c0_g1_i1.p1 TRINITY_DN29050_c0_g1~~TRINITY_DN29050_c0_g1_i1.p1  ORF type:complete len:626 (+),score=173.48 TRINITY_DN29050_c0_g1_i1:86-1963(+)
MNSRDGLFSETMASSGKGSWWARRPCDSMDTPPRTRLRWNSGADPAGETAQRRLGLADKMTPLKQRRHHPLRPAAPRPAGKVRFPDIFKSFSAAAASKTGCCWPDGTRRSGLRADAQEFVPQQQQAEEKSEEDMLPREEVADGFLHEPPPRLPLWMCAVAETFLSQTDDACRLPSRLPSLWPQQEAAVRQAWKFGCSGGQKKLEAEAPLVVLAAPPSGAAAAQRSKEEALSSSSQHLQALLDVEGSIQRLAETFAGLLDRLFDPASLQHNRQMQGVLMQHLPLAVHKQLWEGIGPMTPAMLRQLRLSTQDLLRLPDRRLGALLKKLPGGAEHLPALLRRLPPALQPRHLAWRDNASHIVAPGTAAVADLYGTGGAWELLQPPEIRRLVEAPAAATPSGGVEMGRTVSVMSLTVTAWAFQDAHLRQNAFVRQLQQVDADIVALQGYDVLRGGGSRFLAKQALVGFAVAGGFPDGEEVEANLIFWRTDRWQLVDEFHLEKAKGVDLALRADESTMLRVISAQPTLADCCDDRAALNARLDEVLTGATMGAAAPAAALRKPDRRRGPVSVLVCADLRAVGGAEGAALVPGLCALRSAHVEVLGEEVVAPEAATAAARRGDHPSSLAEA